MIEAASHVFGFNAVDVTNRYEVEGAVTTYVYNRDRQLEAVEQADGSRIEVSCDGGGRISSMSSGSSAVGYTYDSAGRLQSVTGDDGTLTYTHDGPLLKSVASSGAVSGTVTYTRRTNMHVNAYGAGVAAGGAAGGAGCGCP